MPQAHQSDQEGRAKQARGEKSWLEHASCPDGSHDDTAASAAIAIGGMMRCIGLRTAP
jgi:hypothetical protein